MPAFHGSAAQGPGLRAALLLRVLLPVALVLGAASALTLVTLEREVEGRMKEDVELVARGVQLPLLHALEEDRWEAVSQALQSALEIRRLYGAHIYGPDGSRLASFGAGLADEAPDRVAELALTRDQVGEYGETGGRRVYSYFVPLVDEWGQTLGILQVTRRRRDIDDSIQRVRAQVGGVFALGIALVTLLLLRGHHRAVGRPLERLRASMSRVREGDRGHRASLEGPRELAEVTASFNDMLEAMDEAEGELRHRREAQRALRRELARAEKLAAVGELAGGVAHELGSPLTVIDGTAQRMIREHPPGETRNRLEDVRREVSRMEDIIRQLLEFGRQDSGRTRTVRLDQVVAGAVAATRDSAGRAGIDVVAEPLETAGAQPRVEADPRRLEEALVNLIRNGVQAILEKDRTGTVRVRWGVEGGEALLLVDDDGPGIPPTARERIFEPFFTTKPTGEGTGLGLAVVHGTVEALEGTVEAMESPLGGARFRLRVPLVEEAVHA
jgi:two-component system, NtrC family, sensor kinase